MDPTSETTSTPQTHRTFAELMNLSSGVFRKGDSGLLEKQAQAHRAAAEASQLPAVRAHLIGLADGLETILAAHRGKVSAENGSPARDMIEDETGALLHANARQVD